jgi:benzoyl-CoA reductase/2-hydroxyglutaryl-CoA dehydratase subunit BcrC/BadD/HgdB
MQKHYNVPHFIIDGPVLSADPEPMHIDFFRSELKRLIAFLEEQTKQSMDMDRLEEVTRLSNVASDYFTKILESRKVVPCPISSHQLCGDMFHITTLPGTEETTAFYEELYADISERVEQKIGVVADEQFRLIWDNIPIWHDLALIDYFESQNMVFVYETFFKEYWAKRMIGADPFESLGRKYLTGWTNRRLDRKIEIMSDVVRDYQVDGVVVFENKGCRAYSTGQLDVAESLKETFGIPYLAIEGNMADPGGHDADKVRKMVDNFQEVMRGRSRR